MWRSCAMRALVLSLMLLPCLVDASETEVDVELVLAVDVSRSMSDEELAIQRKGYAEALRAPDVLAAVQNGMLGRIAVTYVEWAGEYAQRTVVPWTLLADARDAEAIAADIAALDTPSQQRTSISNALLFAADSFDDNGFAGLRRVIDVSGDGPNNHGRPVLRARDAVTARGITINGLPLMTTDAMSELWGIDDLDVYYANCVIGGPGSFVLPVLAWDEFAAAVKRKLILEIAERPAPLVLASAARASGYDCLIGEKIWERNRGYFLIP